VKLAIALGGFLGFAVVVGAGLVVRRDPALVALEASLACVLGAVLFRWLHQSFVRHLNSSLQARRQSARAGAAAATAAADKAHTAKS
jgi:hypothetical protein